MPLSDYILVDTTTGTILNPEGCVLVPESALSEAEWEAFDNSADSDVCAIGKAHGKPLSVEVQALDAVAALLNAEQWSSDYLNAVADMIRATGRTIEDV